MKSIPGKWKQAHLVTMETVRYTTGTTVSSIRTCTSLLNVFEVNRNTGRWLFVPILLKYQIWNVVVRLKETRCHHMSTMNLPINICSYRNRLKAVWSESSSWRSYRLNCNVSKIFSSILNKIKWEKIVLTRFQ